MNHIATVVNIRYLQSLYWRIALATKKEEKPPAIIGRPSKARLKAPKKPGRPVETRGRIAEFKERLMATSGTKVIDKVISIAQDDEHPGQMAALKMCMDRILPVSLFEKQSGQKPQIQINIVNTTQEDDSVQIDVSGAEDIEVKGESDNDDS